MVYPRERRLFVDGAEQRIGGRAFDLLLALLSDPEHTFGRDELYESVWADVAVEPNNLAVQLLALRRVLGRDAIVTVPRRGYRLVAPVRTLGPPLPGLVPGQPSASLHAVAAWVADRLVHERWITLVAVAQADAQGVAAAACELHRRERGRVLWRWDGAEPGTPGDTALRQRLARTDALVLVREAGMQARLAISRWWSGAGDAARLRVLAVAAAAPAALPGEAIVQLRALMPAEPPGDPSSKPPTDSPWRTATSAARPHRMRTQPRR